MDAGYAAGIKADYKGFRKRNYKLPLAMDITPYPFVRGDLRRQR